MELISQEAFKRAILEPGPPENFALQTVQEVIKPQVFPFEESLYLNSLAILKFFVIRGW